jgi:acyl-coenzyme A synthetase/AMP-(fatty) acid ligase
VSQNISTIEVEDILYRHPSVLEAAVVARRDPMWGEMRCALVTLKAETRHARGAQKSREGQRTSRLCEGPGC